MSNIKIQKIGVTKLDVDAVVNAANSGLWEGGGVCGAIFKEAGSAELTKACSKYGHCDVGSAVITSGFKLKAKYIIHAVGPQWVDGNHGEPSQLYDAYKSSLELAKENGCHSIGFPLISSGVFGYPKDGAWRKAVRASVNFIKKNPDYDMTIIFAILDDKIIAMGEKILAEIVAETGVELSDASTRECEINVITDDLDAKAVEFFKANLNLLKAIAQDAELQDWFRGVSPYQKQEGHEGLIRLLDKEFFHRAYNDVLVIQKYGEVIETTGLDKNMVSKPTKEWADTLSKTQILACVAYHYRADQFDNGCLYRYSVAEGHLIPYFEAYLEKSK